MQKYERHLSALAMVAGFVADNLLFTRIDVLQTHLVFIGYAAACVVAIPLQHWLEARGARGKRIPRWRVLLPLATQFALGGFWSGFVIFYGRSAVFGASWPFLLFLFLVFLGSEYFHQYHARLVFTSILFFFALYSYAIFAVPVFTHTIDTGTFLLSGAIAVGVFSLFTLLLRFVARERFHTDVRRIRLGAGAVLLLMNLFYFTNILPPLPLSTKAAGIYHLVWHVPGAYLASGEWQSWQVRYLGFAPTLHVVAGDVVYAYSSIFAPTALTTTISHHWQWYDPTQKKWVPRAVVEYPIVGGREQGYRGYSKVYMNEEGSWRVNIQTADGRLIEQLPFTVVHVPTPPDEKIITLK